MKKPIPINNKNFAKHFAVSALKMLKPKFKQNQDGSYDVTYRFRGHSWKRRHARIIMQNHEFLGAP